MVASFLVATSAFGQNNNSCAPACPPPKPACPPASCCKPCPPPREPLPCPTIPAYNAPARWETRCAWDVWVDASFIYWQPFEDGLDPAVYFKAAPTLDHDSGLPTTANVAEISFKPKFKPGFKVGIGMNFDHDSWDGHAEYTRFHGIHKMSGTTTIGYAPLVIPFTLDAAFLVLTGVTELPTSFKERWTLNMDFIDVDMGRWYWVGTALTFRPSVGARGGWINQKLAAQFFVPTPVGVPTAGLFTAQKSRSWCVGPRMGIETNWMVGDWGCNNNCYDGFRFFGNGFADITFTRYKRFQDSFVGEGPLTMFDQQFVQYKLNTIRTHLDLELGIAWGSYFDNNNWHLDLSAGYGFQIFFHQNQFAGLTASASSDLTIQGLTATARLDF